VCWDGLWCHTVCVTVCFHTNTAKPHAIQQWSFWYFLDTWGENVQHRSIISCFADLYTATACQSIGMGLSGFLHQQQLVWLLYPPPLNFYFSRTLTIVFPHPEFYSPNCSNEFLYDTKILDSPLCHNDLKNLSTSWIFFSCPMSEM
jgi:hypothetical protein